MRSFALSLVVMTALGCYSVSEPKEPEFQGQSYPEAMRAICEVDQRAGIVSDDDPISLGRKRSDWVREHVENPDGIFLRTVLSVKGATEQAKEIREEASGCGLTTCALADDLEKTGMGGLAP